MNKTLKLKWIKALRSGKYKQGNGALYDGREYCCLGVLARVQGAKTKAGTLTLGGEDVRRGAGLIKEEFLAHKYSAGLRENTQSRLADMNDGSGIVPKKSFREIADYIEKHIGPR